MRRQYFWWTYLVGCIVCIAYGGSTLLYHYRKGNGLSIHSLILLIVGAVLLVLFLILYIWSLIQKRIGKKNKKPEDSKSIDTPNVETDSKEQAEILKEEPQIERPLNNKREEEHVSNNYINQPRKSYGSSSYNSEQDAYVRKVGYGHVLRVTGNRILDMRNNTYYHIQGNMVNLDGSGPIFEINGNSIRSAFGGYLYEISGNNVNKVFGGLYASISGNYLTVFDLSEKYEITDSLNRKQLLVVVALLFGAY